MIDFRILHLNSGENLLCIVKEENHDSFVIVFPLVVKVTTIPVGENTMREIHTTSVWCPFTDDKMFMFYKDEICFLKSLNQDAVTFYVDMLNRQEDQESLIRYGLEELVRPESMEDDSMDDKAVELLRRMEEIEDETDDPAIVKGGRTLH